MVSKTRKASQRKPSSGPVYALLLALGVTLAIVIAIVLSSQKEGHLGVQPKPSQAVRPSAPQPAQPDASLSSPRVIEDRKEEETPPPPQEIAIPEFSGSKFQRRLQFGDFLKVLKKTWEGQQYSEIAVGNALAEGLAERRQAQLLLDNISGFERKYLRDEHNNLISIHQVGALGKLFDWLDGASRSDVHLMLSSQAKEAATTQPELQKSGKGALLRVWSKRHPVEEFNVNEAERMIRQLHVIAKREITSDFRGYDALVGEGLGDEFFPHNTLQNGNAQGLYVIQDQVALVRSQAALENTESVLKHELVHAFTYTLSENFESSRFVSEGLAEYLRALQSGEEEQGPPDLRFAGEAQTLLSMLRMMRGQGADLRDIDFEKLVNLSPANFYALGPFGYLTAQCALASIAWSNITQALRAKEDAPIVSAISGISWASFEIFLESIAAKSKQSVFIVRDRITGAPEGASGEFKQVMRQLGAKIPHDSLDPNVFNVASSLATGARAARTFLSTAAGAETLVISDVSDQLANYFQLADLSGIADFPFDTERLNVVTGKLFVEELYRGLDESEGLRAEGALGEMHQALVGAPSLELSLPPIQTRAGGMSFIDVSRRISQWQGANEVPEPPLIIVVTGQDAEARSRIQRAYASELAAMPEDDREEFTRQTLRLFYFGLANRDHFHAGPILVIDLAKGQGDADAIADALSQRYELQGLTHSVTYWDPQQSADHN